MINRISRALLVFILAVLAAVTAPTPARAASIGQCPSANICIWDSINYTTYLGGWTAGYILTLPNDCLSLPSSARGRASSIYVNAGLMSRSLTLWGTNGANRGISGASTPYQDANMLTSPGIASFSNVLSEICVND